jgi:hypothetical protein
MFNHIELAQHLVPLLDETYRASSLTSILDGNPELAREGANANELIIPRLDMQGLGDYSRNSGYVEGEVTLTNQTVLCNFDRGRMFSVDSVDDTDSACLCFGMLAGEFIRNKVAPELDAFRFATYASASGIGVSTAALNSGSAVITALREATNYMDEDEVPEEQRFLFITPSLMGLVEDLDTLKSKAVLSRFADIRRVPQSRFQTAITLRDGSSTGQEAGGFVKASSASDINFLILHKAALIQFPKHIAPKIVTPEINQTADAWKFGYRQVGVVDVYQNKTAGIYLHKAR